MIAISNTTDQTLAAGESITFDKVLMHTGCAECFIDLAPSVKLKANGVYEVTFSANIAGGAATTQVELSLQIGGVTIPYSTMLATSTASGDYYHVSVSVPVKITCGDFNRITVTNTGTTAVTVDVNSILYVRRVA